MFTNLHNIDKYFTDETVCIDYLEKLRWDNKPACLRCGSLNPYVTKNHNKRGYKCRECKYNFNVLAGTIFENTKLPLGLWFKAIYIASNHKKGIASCQLARDLGITQKSAWFVLSRVRTLLKEKAPIMLEKTVEIDSTLIGGKISNKNVSKRKNYPNYTDNKTTVLGIVQRGGKIVNVIVDKENEKSVLPVMYDRVKKGSTIITDSHGSYKKLKLHYSHASVNHEIKEYVRGDFHTNTIEGYWSLMKRGIIGIYHQVSAKHLHRYCDEFAFRYNTREEGEQERFTSALQRLDFTRLRYVDLIAKV